MAKPMAAEQIILGGPYVESGADLPTEGAGMDRPIGSLYIARTNGTFWQKVGLDALDWIQFLPQSGLLTLPNGNGVPLAPGMPVLTLGGQFLRGNASSPGTAAAIGIVVIGAVPTAMTTVAVDGAVTLPTEAWDAVTGQVGGLTENAVYYLGLSSGTLTSTPPSAEGESVTEMGSAATTTSLIVSPRPPILL